MVPSGETPDHWCQVKGGRVVQGKRLLVMMANTDLIGQCCVTRASWTSGNTWKAKQTKKLLSRVGTLPIQQSEHVTGSGNEAWGTMTLEVVDQEILRMRCGDGWDIERA